MVGGHTLASGEGVGGILVTASGLCLVREGEGEGEEGVEGELHDQVRETLLLQVSLKVVEEEEKEQQVEEDEGKKGVGGRKERLASPARLHPVLLD